MYRNFTEALMELFGAEKTALEIAPGTYTIPTISIIQNLKAKVFIAVDGAFDLEDSFRNFNQCGGLQYYSKEISDFFGRQLYNLLAINSLAHKLPLRSESVHYVLFVKTLYKLTDGILHAWESAKNSVIEEYKERGINQLTENEYKSFTIFTYGLLVLDEARRIGKEGIIIIPESNIVEKEALEEIKIYSELTENDFYVLNVQRPTWKIEKEGKTKEVGHWQDNSSNKLIYLKIKNHDPLSKEGIAMYLRKRFKSSLYKNYALRSLYEKIL